MDGIRRAVLALFGIVGAAGCGLPVDEGVVMASFGFITQTVQGQGVVPEVVTTNLYFGGCNPADPGMQIIERVTAAAAAADPTPLLAASDIRITGWRPTPPSTRKSSSALLSDPLHGAVSRIGGEHDPGGVSRHFNLPGRRSGGPSYRAGGHRHLEHRRHPHHRSGDRRRRRDLRSLHGCWPELQHRRHPLRFRRPSAPSSPAASRSTPHRCRARASRWGVRALPNS